MDSLMEAMSAANIPTEHAQHMIDSYTKHGPQQSNAIMRRVAEVADIPLSNGEPNG